MTTSRYILLSPSVLLEYIYADQAAINNAGNPYRLSTTQNPIWKTKNDRDGQDIILNADSAEVISQGLPIGTGNVRNRSYAYVDPYRNALLDISRLTFYNDFDSALTPTANLPINFDNEQAPVYDTVRIHLVQGFNFESYIGFTFNIKATRNDSKLINLVNLAFNKTDVFETLNPAPFFFAGRSYGAYIEVRVLSLYNLIYDYWLGTLNGDTVVERVTSFKGIKRDQQIQINFSWIRDRKQIIEQDYIYTDESVSIDIPVQDQFESIAAKIEESKSGDYIEFYATYKENIIENFILDLNRNGYNFAILHDLFVYEWIYDAQNNNYYWKKTDEYQLTQTEDYDLPNTFRPVIKNPSAISFRIDYVVRLYNRADNSQIWKKSSMISNSAAKYGRKLQQINLGSNPVQSVIYNKNVIKEIKINKISDPVLDNTKYITSFIDASNISISFDTIDPNSGSAISNSSSSNISANGLGRILISDAISYIKFVVYKKEQKTGGNVAVDLSGLGDLLLVFTSENKESLSILEYPNTFGNKSKGEVIFRIAESESTQILGYTDKKFKIYLRNTKGEKTFLYSGRFYDQNEWIKLKETDALTALQNSVSGLSFSNSVLNNQISSQSNIINELNKKLVSSSVSSQDRIDLKNTVIENLSKQVAELTGALELAESKLLYQEGLNGAIKNKEPIAGVVAQNTTSKIEKDLEANKANIQKDPFVGTSGSSISGVFLPRIIKGSGLGSGINIL